MIRRNFWQSLKNSVHGVQSHLKFSKFFLNQANWELIIMLVNYKWIYTIKFELRMEAIIMLIFAVLLCLLRQ